MCHWKADCLRFRKIGSQLYKINLVLIDRPKLLEFKITRGDWSKEACTQTGKVLPNFELMTNGGSVDYTITIENWCDQKKNSLPVNVVHLDDFEMTVWVKAKYKSLSSEFYENFPDKKFPLSIARRTKRSDPLTSAFGKEWGVDETIEMMIKRKQSDGFIVVAIPCHCRERNAEYNYYEKGELYARSLVEDLIPYIDRNFRSISAREGRFTMGSSMGALISFSILWEYPI